MHCDEPEFRWIVPTSDLLSNFCSEIGYTLDSNDLFELMNQAFTYFDSQSPFETRNTNVLNLASFLFLNDHQVVPEEVSDRIQRCGYKLFCELLVRLTEHNIAAAPDSVELMPYSMVGSDVCLTHYKS